MYKEKEKEFQDISTINQDSSPNLDDIPDYDPKLEPQSQLNMHQLYFSNNPAFIIPYITESTITAQEVIKKIVQSTIQLAQKLEIERKVPMHALSSIVSLSQRIVVGQNITQDTLVDDFSNNGLTEDQEPELSKADQWIRAKIQVDKKTYEIKNEINQIPPRNLTSEQKSVRSGKLTFGYKSQLKDNLNITIKSKSDSQKQLAPQPIDLTEPLNISDEEEKLRNQKENERKVKELKQEKEKKQRQKENKAQGYTYDYDGNLIPVQKIKIQKLPPSAQQIGFQFKEEEKQKEQKKKKKTNKIKSEAQAAKLKKAPEIEKEFSKMVTNSQPPLLDHLQLSSGVTLTFEGKRRQGPRPNTVDLQTLTSTDTKVRLQRKQYDEFIRTQGFSRGKQESEARMLHSAGDQLHKQDGDSMIQTLDKMNFLTLNKQNRNLDGTAGIGGGIKISSNRVFETMTQTISEEDEILLKIIKEKEKKEKEEREKERKNLSQKKSPVDEFNWHITTSKEWGRTHYGSQGNQQSFPFGAHKPSDKELTTTLGMVKKPRERLVLKTPESAPGFDLRASTSEGFYRSLRTPMTGEGKRPLILPQVQQQQQQSIMLSSIHSTSTQQIQTKQPKDADKKQK